MQPATHYQRLYDPHEFIELLAPIDLVPATGDECDVGRALAARLISPHIASAETFRRVQARTAAAIFVQRAGGEVTGVTAMLPLNALGRHEILQHRFVPKLAPDNTLCRPGEAVHAMYAWGFAATTRKASAAVVSMTIRLRDHYLDIPFFARAVTPAGRKVTCGRMGYSPYPGAPDDLLWNPVIPLVEERAA